MFCKAPLSQHNAQDFKSWALASIAKWPVNRSDPSDHFKSQVLYTPKFVSMSAVLHLRLEEANTTVKQWMNTMCGDCADLYTIKHARVESGEHNLSIIYNDASLLHRIVGRFMDDFRAFGYPVIV